MTNKVDTAFERHFSEPPVVAVKEGRTHCEACKEALDPTVLHKCHGNQEYQAPVYSTTDITETCPVEGCGGDGVLVERDTLQGKSFVIVCKVCRTFVWPEVTEKSQAIHEWNATAKQSSGYWPKWRAELPGDDERATVIASDVKLGPHHPDLANYRGKCPGPHIDGHQCPKCEGTGVIPPTKPEPVPVTEIVVPPEGGK